MTMQMQCKTLGLGMNPVPCCSRCVLEGAQSGEPILLAEERDRSSNQVNYRRAGL